MAQEFSFFATTAKGMEALLREEITSFAGARDVVETRAGVSFSGPLDVAYRACLWSRVANRVLLPIRKFQAETPEQLYGGIRSIHWNEHMRADQTLAVDFAAAQSKITHTHFGALKAKDAVVDQFKSKEGCRPSVDTLKPDLRINIYLLKDEAQVSIDLSGESLHLRGYREEASRAPLKENLAAAMLQLARWKEIAARGGAFIDPMCGSGTLPIEAALIACDIAPGLKRKHFGFSGWKGHDPKLWKSLLDEAESRVVRERKRIPPIVGYDKDRQSITFALANLERAGLRGVVHFERRDLSVLEPVETFAQEAPMGLVIVNPPYGERLGEVEELKPLYGQLGDLMKQKFKGWQGFILTGSPDLAKSVGLRARRRHILFNGPIECRLLEYELY